MTKTTKTILETTLYKKVLSKTSIQSMYTMKKNFIAATITLSVLLPFYGYAEDVPITRISATTKEREVENEVKNKTAQSETAKEGVDATTTIPVAIATPEKNFTLCSQEAIEVRDTKIANSRSVYNTAMANALTERKNREKAAVAITDESKKKIAIKTSVDTYKNLVKSAQNNLTTLRKNAWQDFENDINTCRDIQDKEIAKNTSQDDTTSGDVQKPEPSSKKEASEESTLIKDTIKAGIDSLKSLFN